MLNKDRLLCFLLTVTFPLLLLNGSSCRIKNVYDLQMRSVQMRSISIIIEY
jgi:hypothetical protein